MTVVTCDVKNNVYPLFFLSTREAISVHMLFKELQDCYAFVTYPLQESSLGIKLVKIVGIQQRCASIASLHG